MPTTTELDNGITDENTPLAFALSPFGAPSMDDPTGPDRPPVSRAEPIKLSDFIRCRDPRYPHAVFTGLDSFNDVPHPFGGMCKVCELAGRETKLTQLWRQIDQKLAPGWFPVNCCDQCYADAQIDAERLKNQREWWLAHCPVEFRDEWDNDKGDARLLTRVLQFSVSSGRGLIIHGPTDTGKTRAVWRLLRKLSEDGTDWLFVEAIDLLDCIPERAFVVPVLVIDDLGNDVLTAQKEVRLLKVLRVRTQWHRPTLVTTQFSGEAIAKRFTESNTAQAVIRRLRMFCDDVPART